MSVILSQFDVFPNTSFGLFISFRNTANEDDIMDAVLSAVAASGSIEDSAPFASGLGLPHVSVVEALKVLVANEYVSHHSFQILSFDFMTGDERSTEDPCRARLRDRLCKKRCNISLGP